MRFDYRFNSGKTGSEPTLRCRRYRIDGNRLCLDGYYPAGTLAITEATDGDGRQVLTFTDFQARRYCRARLPQRRLPTPTAYMMTAAI